jgi:hypothetical protein
MFFPYVDKGDHLGIKKVDFARAVVAGDCLEVEKMIADGLTPSMTTGLQEDTGMTLLHYAVWGTKGSDIVDELDPQFPPRLVSLVDHLRVARMIIANGADVSPKNRVGHTPLHLAVWNGCPLIVQELLANGADLISVDNDGYTAGHLAMEYQRPTIAALIAAEGPRRVLIAQCEAFAMGKQERLGVGSLVQGLPLEVVRMVTDLV